MPSRLIPSTGLALLDQLGIKTALAILWSFDLEGTGRTFNRFAAFAIAFIATFTLVLIQMSIHLGIQDYLDEALKHRSEGAIRAKQRLSTF